MVVHQINSSSKGAAHHLSSTSASNARRSWKQRYITTSPSFLQAPCTSALSFPIFPYHQCPPVYRLPVQMASSISQVRRRQVLHTLSCIPLYFLPKTSLAHSDDEIIFIKLPCGNEDCRPVEIHDYRVGTGRTAENGSRITVKWTGRLADRYGWPIQKEDADEVSFLLGKDNLIRGFEIAVQGMREGGKRRMIIPAELGYKDERSGPLPASYGDRRRLFATVLNPRRFKRAGDLVIDVQLLKVRPPP